MNNSKKDVYETLEELKGKVESLKDRIQSGEKISAECAADIMHVQQHANELKHLVAGDTQHDAVCDYCVRTGKFCDEALKHLDNNKCTCRRNLQKKKHKCIICELIKKFFGYK